MPFMREERVPSFDHFVKIDHSGGSSWGSIPSQHGAGNPAGIIDHHLGINERGDGDHPIHLFDLFSDLLIFR